MSEHARRLAILMLEEKPMRDIYEGAGPGGRKGLGLYYVTYSDGRSPTLTKSDIQILLDAGIIKEKWPGCYELNHKR